MQSTTSKNAPGKNAPSNISNRDILKAQQIINWSKQRHYPLHKLRKRIIKLGKWKARSARNKRLRERIANWLKYEVTIKTVFIVQNWLSTDNFETLVDVLREAEKHLQLNIIKHLQLVQWNIQMLFLS